MTALCDLLDAHADAVEGDLWDLYGIDVLEVFTGSLSPRRALLFAERAVNDPRSHLRAELMGGLEFVRWTADTYALTQMADEISALVVLVHKALGGKNTPSVVPFPRPRPDDGRAPAPAARTLAEFDPLRALA